VSIEHRAVLNTVIAQVAVLRYAVEGEGQSDGQSADIASSTPSGLVGEETHLGSHHQSRTPTIDCPTWTVGLPYISELSVCLSVLLVFQCCESSK